VHSGVSYGSIHSNYLPANHLDTSGWAKYMEWMYPVEVRYTSKTAFKTIGAVAAATL
jgi:hypothetical protein